MHCVTVKYKQCLERVQWEVNTSPELLRYIKQRCDECNALNQSLEIAIQNLRIAKHNRPATQQAATAAAAAAAKFVL